MLLVTGSHEQNLAVLLVYVGCVQGMKVTEQIQTMLEQGIITRSKSPWMAPAVFVPKEVARYAYALTTRN